MCLVADEGHRGSYVLIGPEVDLVEAARQANQFLAKTPTRKGISNGPRL